MKLRSVLLVLMILILLVFAGCKHQDPPVTTVPTTTTPTTTCPTTTEAPNEGLLLYQAAVQELAQRKDVMLSVTVQETATFPAEERKEKTTFEITYLGLGTDAFEAKVKEANTIEMSQIAFAEVYSGGKVYLTSFDGFYMAEQTAEEFLGRQIPAVLIDETKYTTCTYEEVAGKTEVTFSDCQAFEDWAGHEAGTLISAGGTALIDSAGMLNQYTYDLQYKLLGVEIKQQIIVDIFKPIGVSIEKPTSTEAYVSVPDLDIVELIYGAYFRSMYSTSLSYRFGEEIYSQASAEGLMLNMETHRYGTGKNTVVKFSQTVSDGSGSQETWKFEEVFRDNVYTFCENDGPVQTDTSVTRAQVEDAVVTFVSELMFSPKYITDQNVADLGDVLLITAKGTDEFGKLLEKAISTEFYGEADAIDKYASAYRTEKLDVYLAIDKYFGFCTAMGYKFEGVHTLDGSEYTLYADINAGLTVASQESYNAITDEAMPAESEESPTPLFYHVTGQNGEEMWLLGTIHVGDARTGNLPKEILNAFAASDALALECDPRKMEEEMANPMLSSAFAAAMYYTNGTETEDHISDSELYKLASQVMQASGNKSSYTNMLKVSMWENTISNFTDRLTYSLSSDMGVDNRLMRMAETGGKEILQVESNLSQIVMLGGWSDELAEVLLAESLSTDAVAYHQGVTELYELWCSGDEAAISEKLFTDAEDMTDEEKALWEEYNSEMSTKRNKKMAEVAIEYLNGDKTVFYAVGLAHVIAPDGLVNALREAGYTVTLVTYES